MERLNPYTGKPLSITDGRRLRKRGRKPDRPLEKNKPKNRHHFQNGGTPHGAKTKRAVLLHEAVLQAADEVGDDGQGRGKLVGYLRKMAQKDMKSFATLLAKIMPTQISGVGGGPLRVITTNMTPREAQEAYANTLFGLGKGLIDDAMEGPELLELDPSEYNEATE
jgi:hypothetical protein